jgi:hypothetical protein
VHPPVPTGPSPRPLDREGPERRSVRDRRSCPGPPGAHLPRHQRGGHERHREHRVESTRRSTCCGHRLGE